MCMPTRCREGRRRERRPAAWAVRACGHRAAGCRAGGVAGMVGGAGRRGHSRRNRPQTWQRTESTISATPHTCQRPTRPSAGRRKTRTGPRTARAVPVRGRLAWRGGWHLADAVHEAALLRIPAKWHGAAPQHQSHRQLRRRRRRGARGATGALGAQQHAGEHARDHDADGHSELEPLDRHRGVAVSAESGQRGRGQRGR